MRLLKFLSRVYTKNCIPNAVVIQILKEGDRRDPKITEELVLLTAAERYTLKSLI